MATMLLDISHEDFVSALRCELRGDLPGFGAQKTMSPSIREDLMANTAPSSSTRQSAVLILLFPNGNSIDTLLIKRPVYNGPHSGQISLPGGKLDEADSGMQATALRETFEEVGIEPSNIAVVGELTPLYIPISNMMVHPFVGATGFSPTFKANAKEVERLIPVPVGHLLNPRNRSVTTITSHGKRITAPYFDVSGELVWGATAMILAEFVEVVSGAVNRRQ